MNDDTAVTPYPTAAPTLSGRALSSPGPWSRVLVLGPRSWPRPGAVACCLTETWRAAGQPLHVVTDGRDTGVDVAARDWIGEHRFAGNELAEHGHPAGAWRVIEFVPATDGRDVVTSTRPARAGRREPRT